MADSINLVGKMVCEECDAFLGKPHNAGCSRRYFDKPVTEPEAVERFTTIEHADREEPLLGIGPDTAELLAKWLGKLDLDDPEEIEQCRAVQEGLTTFAAAARELETEEN